MIKSLRPLKYLAASVPAILAIFGNLYGGNYVFLNIAYSFIFLQLLDYLLPEDHSDPEFGTSDSFSTFILFVSVLLHTAAIGTLIYGVNSGILKNYFIWFAAISTGVNSGVAGFVVAHELIHRKEKLVRNLGIWNLLIVNYTHFYVEHVKGHHKNVGTSKDPATARYGENIYSFLSRTITGQFKSAFNIETARLTKIGRKPFSIHNFIIRGLIAQIIISATLYLFTNGTVLAAFWIQSIMAIWLLEIVNYFEHYGLVRGETEKFGPEHAWQSNLTPSRYTLVELSRHSDHHMKASKHYQTLVSHIESPQMPLGYFGSYYLALIPPLWFKVMNPVLEDHYKKMKNHTMVSDNG